jgi:hypothetical protein
MRILGRSVFIRSLSARLFVGCAMDDLLRLRVVLFIVARGDAA